MKKILVVRNDKIGDFMLAWPSFAMLKASLPDCQVTALVPAYTVALAKRCPWIDHVMIDPTQGSSTQEKAALVEQIKAAQFDASINLFSTTYNAKLVWKAKIPYRLAPATKFAQIFYNHRVRQKRSQSLQPEYEYNLDLIRAFITHLGKEVVEPSAPYLSFNHRELEGQKAQLAQHLDLNLSNKWVFVHAGSGGSANNLSLEQYAHLISGMTGVFDVVLTAGPGEEQKAIELKCLMESRGLKAAVYSKNDGLVDFSRSIACADLFIAGSTGPLHIAAAIDIPTVGFFPSKRSATPLRWKPINSEGRHIAFCPPKSTNKASQENMARIDVEQVIQRLAPWAKTFLSL